MPRQVLQNLIIQQLIHFRKKVNQSDLPHSPDPEVVYGHVLGLKFQKIFQHMIEPKLLKMDSNDDL